METTKGKETRIQQGLDTADDERVLEGPRACRAACAKRGDTSEKLGTLEAKVASVSQGRQNISPVRPRSVNGC